ncbi:MAG TPA: NAD(P)-binding domain-containing protein [Thermodesulfovibrionia bacterium]|nr:NAD(P)-binding domain-containing protein [Thermodesulfovibrionia bacterium]
MVSIYDVVIVGGGPGGIAAAIKAKEYGLSYVVLEKGSKAFAGIIESYPSGKKVYPTVPKNCTEPFAIDELKPPDNKASVEDYISMIEGVIEKHGIYIQYETEFDTIKTEKNIHSVITQKNTYRGRNVILAFGSNIPNELNVWGEAKTVARNLATVEDYIGVPCLVIGGGNTSADIVSTLSRTKREALDPYPVFWANRGRKFTVDKDVARDLGEEILLGGNIKILQGAEPKIGEVDEEGVERLLIHYQKLNLGDVEMIQGLSFPMKNVIASIGTHGPEPIFNRLNLQQIRCTGPLCKVGKEGANLLLLNTSFETSIEGVYAIGGAISPAYMLIDETGVIREEKHPNLIYMSINDGAKVIEAVRNKVQQKS